jgi:hypothetical protein
VHIPCPLNLKCKRIAYELNQYGIQRGKEISKYACRSIVVIIVGKKDIKGE